MLRTRRDKHQKGGTGHDSAMVLEAPFDLGLYSPEYTQPDSSTKNFHDGDAAWTRFLAAKPLLYLPDRASITGEDPINCHRRLWTHQELQAFGDEIEKRTRVQLRAQERTLRRWHQSATHIQRWFRGMCGRKYVLQLRRELFEDAATLERAMELARERRRQHKAVVAIQRAYRYYRKVIIERQRAVVLLQSASQHIIHRLRRWQARLKIQRACRCFLWRLRWQRYKQRVRKMLKAATRQQQLVLATEVFHRVRENVLLQRQADTWFTHPERMQMLLKTRRRKQKLQGSHTSGVFPSLQDNKSSKVVKRSNKSVRSFSQRGQGLPSIYPSSRGE